MRTHTRPKETTFDRAIGHLQKIYDEYLETGVLRLETDYVDRKRPTVMNAFGQSKMFRQVAKELGRPFVCVVETKWTRREWDPTHRKHVSVGSSDTHVELRVQRKKGIDDLVGMFLVGGEEGRWRAGKDAVIGYTKMKTAWTFQFADAGRPVLEHFLKECRTNPDFKKVLMPNG